MSAYSQSVCGNPDLAHVCNCVGCCPKCGTCVTWPGHTTEWCDLLVAQKAARAALASLAPKEGT